MRRAITMFSLFIQPFADAERAYRREQITSQFRRSPRPFHLKWPVGLIGPNRRRPRHTPVNRPAPHHVTSVG
jgi:hypothetical protein